MYKRLVMEDISQELTEHWKKGNFTCVIVTRKGSSVRFFVDDRYRITTQVPDMMKINHIIKYNVTESNEPIKCPVTEELTKEKLMSDFLKVLIAFPYTPEEYLECENFFKTDHEEEIDDDLRKAGLIPDLIKDDRAFFRIDETRYLVLSRNLYDVFFCSQGNDWQSCFSLSSTHSLILGVPLEMVRNKWWYMSYITDGTKRHYSCIPDHRLWLPQMSARAWSYYSKNNIFCVGRLYVNHHLYESDALDDYMFILGPNIRSEQVIGNFNKQSYATYWDDLRFNDDEVIFRLGRGVFGRNGKRVLRCNASSIAEFLSKFKCKKEITTTQNIRFYGRGIAFKEDIIECCGLPKFGEGPASAKYCAKNPVKLADEFVIIEGFNCIYSYTEGQYFLDMSDAIESIPVGSKYAVATYSAGRCRYEIKTRKA